MLRKLFSWHFIYLFFFGRRIFQLSPDDTILLASPYTFDPFVVQMFTAFAAGARLIIVPDSVKLAPSKLCQILFEEEKLTVLQVR